jgi:DNA-binding transcriptional LysR family regulator
MMRQFYCRYENDKKSIEMRSLNLDQLRALVEVVEQGSFSAAARRLNLTQPAVSLQIRELEGRIGLPLVERMGKRAFATAAGEELIEHARQLHTGVERALAAMRRYKDGWLGRVRIGTGDVMLTYLLPPVLHALRTTYPNIELVIFTGATTDVLQRIGRNEIDLGLVTLPVNERVFQTTPLRTETFVAILPPVEVDAPESLTPADLDRPDLICIQPGATMRQQVDEWLAAGAVRVRPAMEIDNNEAVKHAVAAGLGASVVPLCSLADAYTPPGLVVRPLRPALTWTLGLVQRRDKPDEPALRCIREALLTLAEGRRPERR